MTSQQTVVDNPSRNRFEIDLGEGAFAFAAYNLLPGAIRFYHTVVPESHGGQGLGTALIRAGLASARERGLKVIPICPFFRAYLRKHPEEQDLISPEELHLLDE
ncbi:MAG TPA: GNAT family N-acetyltransferase [Nitrospiraceae bacterium]|nr:GNAT family N-acetyltransferase [Nitrospiraceae bacterium]